MTSHTIVLQPGGLAFEADADTSILRAAEAAGIELPSSCRNGTCRTCICRVRSGAAVHLIEWPGLSFDEKREGWILPCVAVARGDLELETPLARQLKWEDA
ncbi:MAG: 2Fe-2S iron-sulfur cluster binding domain-containing protein [Lysobacteraceae bacterium]|nr:MAG: 2Fe-2S iron-sulfur cluster binding domain-containing protein [Xanthomonadaceae bacterium]